MNWKFFAKMASLYLRQAGEAKKAEDSNMTGKDDIIGASMVYAADLIDAIVDDKPLPKAPEVLR